MLSIQWLKSLIFIFITMPGAFIYIVKEIPVFKYKSLGEIYLYILFIFDLILGFVFQKYFGIVFMGLVVVGTGVPLVCELNIWKFNDTYRKIVRIIVNNKSLFLFPILEEVHFRWILFTVGQTLSITIFAFILISGLSYGIAHIPYLGIKSLYKIIQGLILATLFVYVGLTMAVLCHISFNTFVYIYRLQYKG